MDIFSKNRYYSTYSSQIDWDTNFDSAAADVSDSRSSQQAEADCNRIEMKFDLFQHDLAAILPIVEASLSELTRPYETTATIHFTDPVHGAPSVDFGNRLRGYFDQSSVKPCIGTLGRLDWKIETKHRKIKKVEGRLHGLSPAAGSSSAFVVRGKPQVANTLKLAKRRHFALGQRQDESRRLTIDLHRSLYKFGDAELLHLGDMGPRLELKSPLGGHRALIQRLSGGELHKSLPFSSLYLYFQHVLRSRICKSTFSHLGELEAKFAVKTGNARDLLQPVLEWIARNSHSFSLLLPAPNYMSRMRRYHVCDTGDMGQATIVETPAGRCSLKTKRNAHTDGVVLVRETVASHTTDTDGTMLNAHSFARAHGLRLLNSFVKTQRKVPFHLRNGLAFQISADECECENGHRLDQLELEFIGDVTGKRPDGPSVLATMSDLVKSIQQSPFAASLRPTRLSKHQYFAGTV